MPANASSSLAAEDRLERPQRWASAHLHYHDALDDLLRSGVRPLIDELAAHGLIEKLFFVRHWQGGQHVRLRILLCDELGEEAVKRLIEALIGRFFTACPSQTIVRAEDYLQAAGWLCQHEFGHRKVTIEPLQPNNSIRYVPYVPEYDRLGGSAGVAAIEPHFIDSSVIALDLIAANLSGQRRTGQALTMMLLAAAALIPDLERLTRFFQDRYRGWAAKLVTGDRARYERYENQFGQHYVRQRLVVQTGSSVDCEGVRGECSPSREAGRSARVAPCTGCPQAIRNAARWDAGAAECHGFFRADH